MLSRLRCFERSASWQMMLFSPGDAFFLRHVRYEARIKREMCHVVVYTLVYSCLYFVSIDFA